MARRRARWGFQVYEVKLASGECVYQRADTVTTTSAGALMLSVEVPEVDSATQHDEDVIENLVTLVLPAGQWQSCIHVTHDTHEPEFRQDVFDRLYGSEDDEDDEGDDDGE